MEGEERGGVGGRKKGQKGKVGSEEEEKEEIGGVAELFKGEEERMVKQKDKQVEL